MTPSVVVMVTMAVTVMIAVVTMIIMTVAMTSSRQTELAVAIPSMRRAMQASFIFVMKVSISSIRITVDKERAVRKQI